MVVGFNRGQVVDAVVLPSPRERQTIEVGPAQQPINLVPQMRVDCQIRVDTLWIYRMVSWNVSIRDIGFWRDGVEFGGGYGGGGYG